MPNYTFKCPDCAKEATYYLTYKEMKETLVFCPDCFKKRDAEIEKGTFDGSLVPFMERVLKATSTALQTKEVIDNGLQVKKIERLAGVTEMIRDRADDNDKS